MSFVWTAVSVGDKFTEAHYNQVKTNVDHLTTQLSIAAYSWVIFPVTQFTSKFNYNDTDELRDALDYVEDNNVCVTNYADRDTTIDNDQHGTYNLGTNSPVNSSQNTGVK